MIHMPNNLAMHLMLAMMQSGGFPSGSTPWSNSSLTSLHNFFPWLPKPKSPLEQGIDAAQNLWQNQSDQWQKASQAFFQNVNPPQSENSAPNPFAEFYDPAFLSELGTQAYNHSTGFLQGLQAYLASDYERPQKAYDALWSRGSAQLFDLAPERTDGVAVLCVPSLINKSHILDLTPETSFVEFLKAEGMRPLILDWGTPAEDEEEFSTADYITAYALDALQTLRDNHDGPIVVLGYCMGGIFATAMAQLAPLFVDALILLATPWDFSAEDTPRVLLNPATQGMLRNWIAQQNPVQPMVTQTIFHMIDPWRVQEKYQRYPTLTEKQKQHFLAVEHWVNDGVPLAQKTAEECFVDWPQGNILAEHKWKVGRRWIEPESIKQPVLAVIPTRDLIVPVGCARPLAAMIKRCDVLEPDTGHVSMVVGSRARSLVWEPISRWIQDRF